MQWGSRYVRCGPALGPGTHLSHSASSTRQAQHLLGIFLSIVTLLATKCFSNFIFSSLSVTFFR